MGTTHTSISPSRFVVLGDEAVGVVVTWLDGSGYVAMAVIASAKVAIAHKHRYGWLMWMAAAVWWMVIALQLEFYSLFVGNAVFFLQYWYGYYKWGKDERADNSETPN